MQAIMEFIGKIVADNSTVLAVTTIFTALAGTLAYSFYKKVIPAMLKSVVKFVATIIGKLFKMDPNDIVNGVGELPIVEDLKTAHKEFVSSREVELIKLKQKLISGKLTETERIVAEHIYDKYITELGDEISDATVELLKKLERGF